ncbi:MAG: NTP transferase domain-containing protein [archaeon]|nr:NTP transferase domain-containing protein [archaeon]
MKNADDIIQIAAVVLAGGISKRFKGDKLLAEVEHKPIIARVFDSLADVTSNLYLSVSSETRANDLLNKVSQDVKVVVDRKELACEGPARGIVSSLVKIQSNAVLFVPADIPWVGSAELRTFVARCEKTHSDVGTIFWNNGAVEMLIQYHKRETVRDVAQTISKLRKKSMRPSDILRGARSTSYINAGNVTNNPLCFSNVNTVEDLMNPKPRNVVGGQKRTDISVVGSVDDPYWKAIQFQANGELDAAAKHFKNESNLYLKYNLDHIALHSLQDYEYCLEHSVFSTDFNLNKIKEKISKLRDGLHILPKS